VTLVWQTWRSDPEEDPLDPEVAVAALMTLMLTWLRTAGRFSGQAEVRTIRIGSQVRVPRHSGSRRGKMVQNERNVPRGASLKWLVLGGQSGEKVTEWLDCNVYAKADIRAAWHDSLACWSETWV
jgi:hypothetical protein